MQWTDQFIGFSAASGHAFERGQSLLLAYSAYIIQAEYGFSDVETALQIQENPYLQFFCGYPGYNDKKLPFDPSLMVYFRKRLTPAILGEINEMILQDAKNRRKKENQKDDDKDDHSGNDGSGGTSDTHLSGIDYRMNRRPGKLPHVSDNVIDWERYIENRRSSVRCKVERAFWIIKCQFGYKKTVYRGLKKNENRLYAMFACANLYALAIAGRKLATARHRESLPFFGKWSGKVSQ